MQRANSGITLRLCLVIVCHVRWMLYTSHLARYFLEVCRAYLPCTHCNGSRTT
ncbi:hypothetical protein BDV09DRAFT_168656 [Aspergillus tetrazonus]